MHLSLLAGLSSLLYIVAAQSSSTFTPARPPSLPLAVKSPYLSTWLPAGSDFGNGGYLPGQWPSFWTYGLYLSNGSSIAKINITVANG